MKRTPSLVTAVITSFLVGWLVSAGVSWWVKVYLFPPATVAVRGVLKMQVAPADPSASANPPNGYYVESSVTERFYVEGEQVKPYVGSSVFIQGTLSTTCGPSGYPCYPKLLASEVRAGSQSAGRQN